MATIRDTTNQIRNQVRQVVKQTTSDVSKNIQGKSPKFKNIFTKDNLLAMGTDVASDYFSDLASNQLFDDSELGRVMGTLFSSGVSSMGSTLGNNLVKGTSLLNGLGKNALSSLAGAGAGIAANYMGQGVTSLMGNSRLGKAVGAGLSTGVGALGGTMASAAVQGKNAIAALGNINPAALGMGIAGAAIGAATGPSKEYGGKYGNITQTMDTVYDIAQAGVNFIPGVGQGISGLMALNKGLSNVFGSTDGMTVQDAILGSAFMPAPVKWLNMWGSSKTGTFDNQSWQNSEKANSFMGNAFGNLGERFDKAREEAGKTYGTFSQGAKRRAQENIDFANNAWGQILSMADQNELQNIRSQYMSSINNQRYAQMIQGGWSPLAIGKRGMKIFNNATNHNMGMRLLSAAALIDNKQMILCSAVD